VSATQGRWRDAAQPVEGRDHVRLAGEARMGRRDIGQRRVAFGDQRLGLIKPLIEQPLADGLAGLRTESAGQARAGIWSTRWTRRSLTGKMRR